MIRTLLWRFIGICLAGCGVVSAGDDARLLSIPMSAATFSADEGCQWMPAGYEFEKIRRNAQYLAAPQPGGDWAQWMQSLRDYRTAVRTRLHDPSAVAIDMRFDGVRAWMRVARHWAWAFDLAPGEQMRLRGEARSLHGNNRFCLAFDWLDRTAGLDGAWQGWSGVVETVTLQREDGWQPFEITVNVPPFDAAERWARPILGMDGTFDKTPGRMALRRLELRAPRTDLRARKSDELRATLPARLAFDDSIYRREDQQWMTRNFVCGFLFAYDRSFWDPDKLEYRVGPLCADATREFGGYDSVVIWHAYPRIGADHRNQFDFFRDMPGGLDGVRGAVREFQQQGVRVFLPYNPWDTGTNREPESDDQALARLVEATQADGLFLDTMLAAPTGLRKAIDAVRLGVAFEPEGHPSMAEMQQCSASWAQWLQAFPEIGVLHLKWIEPRHMQHQIRRWDKSHQHELAAAWLNGSGVLVWENIFGYWNPWQAEDRATLRRMAPVWRQFADHFSQGNWLPYFPTSKPGTYASCWERNGTRLWTIVRPEGDDASPVVLEVDDRAEEFFDLWQGVPISPTRVGEKTALEVPLIRYGAIVAIPRGTSDESLRKIVALQRDEALRPVPSPQEDDWIRAKCVIDPLLDAPHASVRKTRDRSVQRDMLTVDGGRFTFTLRHMRRECGCYPDAGTPEDKWDAFLIGTPHDQPLEHRMTTDVASCRIDAAPVTNGQFEKFLHDSGYRPRTPDSFLKHWGGVLCPAELRDKPVVYIDIEDARAYAAWAGLRLPSEWEWHRSAAQHGDAFQRGEVWEWTEGVRDDGHTRFVMLRGGCRWKAEGSIWYFPTGPQPIETHAKFLLLAPGLDRCATIGFRCAL
jgi:hypothetical protein